MLLSGVEGVDADKTLAVFVDPYTGKVEGALEQYGSTGALPLRTWIDELHRDLHLGEPGRLYSEFAASWLWVIAGGGLVLWFSRRRARRRLRGTSGRRRTLGLHGTVGAWAAAGFLFLSATGLTWSAYAGANIDELRTSLGQSTPSVSAGATGGEHAGHGAAAGAGGAADHGVGLDKVLAAARAEGLGDPVEIVPPADAGTAYVVKQVQRSWPTKQDSVAVDPATGEVTDTLRFADYPVLAKLTRWGIDLHTGILFGLANQIALMALALALILLVVWGYRMWWQRGRGSAFGRPVPRGAWQQVPPHVLVPLLAGVAVVGYFVPLLGIPLAAFLAVDVLLGEIAHRRAGGRTAAARTRPRAAEQAPVAEAAGVRSRKRPAARRGGGRSPVTEAAGARLLVRNRAPARGCRPRAARAGLVRQAPSPKSPASAEAIRRWGSASVWRPCRWRVRPSISRA